MSQPQSDTGDGSLELNNNNNNLFLLTVQGFKLMTSRLRDVQKNEIVFSCNRKHSNFSHVRKDDSDPESGYVIAYWQLCFIKYTVIHVTKKPTNQQVDSKSTSLWRIVYSRSGWNSLSWYLYCYIRIKIFISIQYIYQGESNVKLFMDTNESSMRHITHVCIILLTDYPTNMLTNHNVLNAVTTQTHWSTPVIMSLTRRADNQEFSQGVSLIQHQVNFILTSVTERC